MVITEVSIGYLRNGQLYLTTTVLEERLVGNILVVASRNNN